MEKSFITITVCNCYMEYVFTNSPTKQTYGLGEVSTRMEGS